VQVQWNSKIRGSPPVVLSLSNVFGNFIHRPLFSIIFIELFTAQVPTHLLLVSRDPTIGCVMKDQGPRPGRSLGGAPFINRVGLDANYELASLPTQMTNINSQVSGSRCCCQGSPPKCWLHRTPLRTESCPPGMCPPPCQCWPTAWSPCCPHCS